MAVFGFLGAALPSLASDWVSIGPFVGRTATALLGDVYAAIEGDGVFRSADRGSTWSEDNEGLTNTNVSAFAVHQIVPPSPTLCPPPCGSPIVYAGTRGGGVFIRGDERWTASNSGLTELDVTVLASDGYGVWAGTEGGRVFRNVYTISGPQTWSQVGSPGDGTPVRSLAAVPGGSTVFSGTEVGLYRSTNEGASWSRLQQNSLFFLHSIREIALDPAAPATIYAAGIVDCHLCGAPSFPGIMKSTDSGSTWTDINGDIGNPFVSSILVTRGGSLYAGTASGVYRSIDGGSSWQSMGLEGQSVVALDEGPSDLPQMESLLAAVVGGGLYRNDFAGGTCRADSTTLCLRGGRFEVRVSWRTIRAGRASGEGQAIPMTFESGAFWFFQPSNVELVVKVLDGGAINGRFWVFWGALTDVGYTLTVTDIATGTQKSYTNPDGQLASGADLESFLQSSGSLSRRPLPAERGEPERHNLAPRE